MKKYTSIVLSKFYGTKEFREFHTGHLFEADEERTEYLLSLKKYIKVIKVENILPIKSYWYKTYMEQYPYVSMIEEILSDKPIEETKYYNYFLPYIERGESVFDWIKTTEQLRQQSESFRNTARDIRDNGFKDKNKIVFRKGLPYGKITFIKDNDVYYIIDGHHRLSILIYLGVKVFEFKENYLMPKK